MCYNPDYRGKLFIIPHQKKTVNYVQVDCTEFSSGVRCLMNMPSFQPARPGT